MSPEYIRHIHRDETAERQGEQEFQIEHKVPAKFTPEEYQDYRDDYAAGLVAWCEAMEDEYQQDDYEQKVRDEND